jgi:hypothetical protein
VAAVPAAEHARGAAEDQGAGGLLPVLRALAALLRPGRGARTGPAGAGRLRPEPGRGGGPVRAGPPGPGGDLPERLHDLGGAGRGPTRSAVQRQVLHEHLRRNASTHHGAVAQGVATSVPDIRSVLRAERDRPDRHPVLHRPDRAQGQRPLRGLPAALHDPRPDQERGRDPAVGGAAGCDRGPQPRPGADLPGTGGALQPAAGRDVVADRRRRLPQPPRLPAHARPRGGSHPRRRQRSRTRGRHHGPADPAHRARDHPGPGRRPRPPGRLHRPRQAAGPGRLARGDQGPAQPRRPGAAAAGGPATDVDVEDQAAGARPDAER